jgi:hypothetical protein
MSDFEGDHPRGPGGKFVAKGAKRIADRDQDKSTASLSRLKVAKSAAAAANVPNAKGDLGATIEPSTGETIRTGYAVSTYRGHEHQVDLEGVEGHDRELQLSRALNHYMATKAHVFAADPNAKLGIWYDRDNKKWSFDVSSVVHSLAVGRALGLKHDQIAIYDIKNQKEIRLGGRLK